MVIKKFGDLGVIETLRRINKNDLLVSCDFNLLHPSIEADKNSAWPAIETSYPLRKFMNEGIFCYNMRLNPYVDFVNDMVAERDLHKKQGKDLLQGLSKKLNFSVFGGNFGKDINGLYKHVTKNWMKHNHDDRVKHWCPMKHSNLVVKLEDDAVVDDQALAKSIIPMPC